MFIIYIKLSIGVEDGISLLILCSFKKKNTITGGKNKSREPGSSLVMEDEAFGDNSRRKGYRLLK